MASATGPPTPKDSVPAGHPASKPSDLSLLAIQPLLAGELFQVTVAGSKSSTR
jgi:hypothetical protein